MEKNDRNIFYHRLIIVVLVLALLGAWISHTIKNHTLLSQEKELSEYSRNPSTSTYIDKLGKEITKNKALDLNLKLALNQNKDLRDDLDRLKLQKPKAVIKYVSEIRTDSVFEKLETKLPCDPFHKEFVVNKPHLKYYVNITDSTYFHSSITIVDTAQFIMADLKEHWWDSPKYSVVFDNKNPDFKVSRMEGYTFTPDKKWYETNIAKIGAGAIAVIVLQQTAKLLLN